MKDIKNTLSNISAILFIIAGAILATSTQVVLPQEVITICIIIESITAALGLWLNGKNPDLSKKSPEQLDKIKADKE